MLICFISFKFSIFMNHLAGFGEGKAGIGLSPSWWLRPDQLSLEMLAWKTFNWNVELELKTRWL